MELGGGLSVREKGSQASVEAGPDGWFVLQGERVWLLEGDRSAVDAAQQALTGLCTRLSPELLEVTFGNAVGLVDVPVLGRLEVVSGKWGRPAFDRMLADLTEVASALPFAAGAAVSLGYDRSAAAKEEVLYHAFIYLRHALSEDVPPEEQLLPALAHVLRDPHRRLERIRERVPLELIHRVEPVALERLVAGQEEFMQVAGTALAGLPLAAALRGHIPLTVEQMRVVSTHDTAENRFVKTFLDQALAIAASVRERAALRPGGPFRDRVVREAQGMEEQLFPIRRHALWSEVGQMVHVPSDSTVLPHRRGYRTVYRHFARLRLAVRMPLADATVRNLLEARDVAELYELWCFFTLASLIKDLLGQATEAGGPEPDDWGLSVHWDLSVRWKDGTRLTYNPRFSRPGGPTRVSYSVPLRPDIGLEIPYGPNKGLHLLDAKFRLDALGQLLDQDAGYDPAQLAAERLGTFKRGDLYKMHTYRDAIVGARSVWILYPGTEAAYYGARAHETAKGLPLELPDSLDGVGGVPLVPTTEKVRPHQPVATDLLRTLLGLPW